MSDICQSVLQRTATATLAVDGHGMVVVFNPAAARLVGEDGASPMGRLAVDVMAEPGPLGILCGVLEEARHSGAERLRCQVVVPSPGGDRTFGYSVSPLDDGAAVMSFSDLSKAVAAERRLAEERSFADVGRVAASMAHELKAPLSTAKLYADLLERRLSQSTAGAEQPSEALDQAEVVKSQICLALDRLKTILAAVSPANARERGVTLTPVEPVVRAVVDDALRRFTEAGIRLNTNGGEHRVALTASELSTVFGNLLTNALEAGNGMQDVVVSVSTEPGRVTVTVADRGPGLPRGDVFAPFFTTKQGGTGLGLWLVRKTVGGAGGDISAASRRGGGAEFRVSLPTPARELLKGRRVLVGEDDRDLRRAEREALCEQGALVTAAGCAEDVLRMPLDWDCALLDCILPGITGVDLARRLPSQTPVLIVSGDERAAAEVATLRDRRAWFLPKPVDLDAYVDTASLLIASR